MTEAGDVWKSGMRLFRALGAPVLIALAAAGARPQAARATQPGDETPALLGPGAVSGIAEAARIDGRHLPEGQPWSPDGNLLAVAHTTGLALWDAQEPSAPPRPILDADVLEVRWSPDGTWLCCRVRVMNGTRGGAVRFQFVSVSGDDAEYRIPNAAIGPWIWADDGKVYFWNGDTGVRKEVAPPRTWLASHPQLPEAPRPELVLVASTERRRPRPRPLLFVPGTPPVESLVDSLYMHAGVRPWCRIESPASWIVTTRNGRRSETVAVNERGGRLVALQPKGEPPLQHVSCSADGRIVAGERCAATDTARACTRIWIGSLDPPAALGTPTFVAMDWEGRDPCVSPPGRHIAIETTGHAVQVFALQPAGASR